MPTNSNQNISNNDEIDLLSLFLKLGEFIKKAFLALINLIGSVLVFLLRKWYYFAVAVALTILSAFLLNKTLDPHFSSDLIMRSNVTHNQPIMTNIERLGDYATTGNYDALSNELNLSIENASVIKDIETFWYYDIGGDGIFDGIDTERKFLSDTSVVIIDSVFVVHAVVYDPAVLSDLETGMESYLESNPFLAALNKQRLSNLKALLIQTEYEIEKLDSLQKREYYTNSDNLRQEEGQIVFTSEKTVRTYHGDMFKLLQARQDCDRELNVYNEVVTIIEGFSVPVEPENGTVLYINKLIWYFLGLAIFLSLIITYRDKIKDFKKSK